MNRSEHLQWCKDRAMEYVNSGDCAQAYSSFVSDMGQHPDTRRHPALGMGAQLMLGGFLETEEKMKRWLNGFY